MLLIVVSFLRVDDKAARYNACYQYSIEVCILIPEAFGNVGILFLLLDHQAPLLPQLKHGGEDRELSNVGVDVVEPELVHRQERSGSPNSCTAVDQDCAWDLKENQYVQTKLKE